MDYHLPRVKPVLLDPDDVAYLHCHLPDRDDPQPTFLILRLGDGELLVEYDHHSLGHPPAALSMRGLEIWWTIPVLQAEAANDLIRAAAPEAQKILDNVRIHGDADTHIAEMTETGRHYTDIVVPHLINRHADPDKMIKEVDAEYWLTADGGITQTAIAYEYGITIQTPDAKLEEIAHTIEAKEAQNSYLVLLGTVTYLRKIRADL